ncbi:MAG: 2-hydroxyacyl-CoA dehydratase [Promethearchaeota archaeon]
MVRKASLENRVIPLRILLETLENTYDLMGTSILSEQLPAFKYGVKYLIKAIRDSVEKARDGLPIVGHHFAFQGEYLKCFDIVPVCLEGVSYILSALLPEGVERYYDLIENWGHPFHTCSSQKGVMGMTLDDLFKFDAIITPTAPCDNTYASYPFFKYQQNIPLILPDIPFLHEDNSYHYYGQQIKKGLEDLGKIIGQKPDWDKMIRAIELDEETQSIQQEIFELKKAVPCPVENIFNAMSAAVSVFMSGTLEKKDFYLKVLNVARDNYKNKRHHSGDEKIRSIWPYMLIFFDLSLCEWLDRELGMSILFDIFNYNFMDPIDTKSDLDTLFYGMARKGMQYPMMKQSTDFYYSFLEDSVKLAKDFKADCFIFTSHIGCKQFGSVGQILREALRDEVGIPLLIVDLDVGDQRMTGMKFLKDKISIFAQTLL